MLRLVFITVGDVPRGPFADIAAEYKKYLSRYVHLDHRVVKTAARVLERVDETSFLVVLDASGEIMKSETLAERLGSLENAGRTVTVILGGADGLPGDVKQSADLLLSLSPMTTTHDLAHVFFLEQLFRAMSIAHGSAYHK